MLKLEDIRKNAAVTGIEPNLVVRVVTTEPVGPDALTVYHKLAGGLPDQPGPPIRPAAAPPAVAPDPGG
jgi:hypothetical protein